MNKIEAVQTASQITGMTTEGELSFLYDLASMADKGQDFVELGTYLGRTLSILASVARLKDKRTVSIDNYSYDGKCSLEKVRNNLVHAGFGKEIDSGGLVLLEGDSRLVPEDMGDIGLLFVDSDHFKKHFDAEMSVWIEHVVEGGIVVCHDYGSPTWLEMTGAINQWFDNRNYKKIGLERRLVGFIKLR